MYGTNKYLTDNVLTPLNHLFIRFQFKQFIEEELSTKMTTIIILPSIKPKQQQNQEYRKPKKNPKLI
jgi:hypothetical protein